MEITSPSGRIYVVGDELGSDEQFKLYQCATADGNRICILKIARQVAFNGLLDREAYLLDAMKKEAISLEEEYGKIKDSDKKLNYHFYFPELIETFVSTEQNNSRINILSLAHIAKDLNDLTPISHLLSRENVRVDPRTSAWILGKLLKMLVFTQSQNISINNLEGDNILINREQHYVTLFDWTKATLGNGQMLENTITTEISKIAQEVVLILGSDLTTKKLLEDKQLGDNRYEDFIKNLIDNPEADAQIVHQKFYELIRSLWPREFYKFTYYLNV